MFWLKAINNIQPAFTADYFVIRTNFFDTGTHFHADHHSFCGGDTLLLADKLSFAVGYSTLRKIVRCQFNRHAVAWYDAD